MYLKLNMICVNNQTHSFHDLYIEFEEKAIYIMKFQGYLEGYQRLSLIHAGIRRLE
jgi:hypothetical protein